MVKLLDQFESRKISKEFTKNTKLEHRTEPIPTEFVNLVFGV